MAASVMLPGPPLLAASCPVLFHPQINYCEEQLECRRVLMLTHFGETGFTRDSCSGTCDNCRSNAGHTFVEEDMSEAAKKGECWLVLFCVGVEGATMLRLAHSMIHVSRHALQA